MSAGFGEMMKHRRSPLYGAGSDRRYSPSPVPIRSRHPLPEGEGWGWGISRDPTADAVGHILLPLPGLLFRIAPHTYC